MSRRVCITKCKSWCNGIKLNVFVLANPRWTAPRPRRKLTLAFFCPYRHAHTYTCATILGDKDVTLRSIIALLVGAIMLHAPWVRIYSAWTAWDESVTLLGSYKVLEKKNILLPYLEIHDNRWWNIDNFRLEWWNYDMESFAGFC